MAARRRPAPHVAWQVLDGEGVLMDLRRAQALGLNEVGAFVWSRLSDAEPDAIAEELAARWDVDRLTAERDVAAFLDELDRRGLVETA